MTPAAPSSSAAPGLSRIHRAGEDGHGGNGQRALQFVETAEPVHARHVVVADDEVKRAVMRQSLAGLLKIRGLDADKVGRRAHEIVGDRLAHQVMIVGEQYSHKASAAVRQSCTGLVPW